MEATIQHRTSERKFPPQRIGASIVQSNSLTNKGTKFEAQIGDPKENKKKLQYPIKARAKPCPRKKRGGYHCGWRIGGWKCRRWEGSTAHGQLMVVVAPPS